MKTHWVPVGELRLPLIQDDDWCFHVPLRPLFAAFGIVWANQYTRLFERTGHIKLATLPVQDGEEITPMTSTPLSRAGWWLRSTPGVRRNMENYDQIDELAERILAAFDIVVSAIMSGEAPDSPFVEKGRAMRIAELEKHIQEASRQRKQRNRLPRVAITDKERFAWIAKRDAGRSYAEIGDEAGRHPAVVRRVILEAKGGTNGK